MAYYQKSKPIYDMFATFIQNSLLEDRSLIWEDKLNWTLENLQELKTRILDAPVYGKKSFKEKFTEQMDRATPELWALMADLFYVYFLPSSHFKFETKYSLLNWCAQSGGLILPQPDAQIWNAQKAGFTRTTYYYHLKIPQFRLLILFSLHLKSQDDRKDVIGTPERLQEALDNILQSVPKSLGRAYDMRHAILHMGFPEAYERIISNQDKSSIIESYKTQVDKELPSDPDQAIRIIREKLEQTYDAKGQSLDFYEDLKSEWRPTGGESIEIDGSADDEKEDKGSGRTLTDLDVDRVLSILGFTKNVIIYGPPGTGKTYIARKVAETLIHDQLYEEPPESIIHQRAIDGLTFYEVIALGMYFDNKNLLTVPEISNQPLIQARFRLSPVKHPTNQVWYYLQSHTGFDSKTVKMTNRAEPFLFEKDETSHWVLTEAGRTYVEQNLADRVDLLQVRQPLSKAEDFIRLVTFHQSYNYEDFVEGLRPVPSEDDPGNILYEIVPGVFRQICNQAANDLKNSYVLIIDEINRGNIAKIFGELITLIEDDKRKGSANELAVKLPHNPDVFSVPENLYLIGTMNTADRSIALLDVALRRRFAFVEMVPRPDLLAKTYVESENKRVPLHKVMGSLNKEIVAMRGRDYQLGHSYFLKVADTPANQRLEILEYVWNHQILPLLEEYFYSQPDKLAELLSPFRDDLDEESESDEFFSKTFEIPHLTGDDLLSALDLLIESESNSIGLIDNSK